MQIKKHNYHKYALNGDNQFDVIFIDLRTKAEFLQLNIGGANRPFFDTLELNQYLEIAIEKIKLGEFKYICPFCRTVDGAQAEAVRQRLISMGLKEENIAELKLNVQAIKYSPLLALPEAFFF